MTAISRSKTKIWILPADTTPASLGYLSATSVTNTEKGYFSGDIKSYSKSGGDKDVEADPVFGGYVDKEKPISQVELSLEIVPSLETARADRWDAITYSADAANAGVYTMASETSTQPTDRMVVIEADDGTNRKTLMFNNCNVTVLDLEHNADDNRTYNMTLKFAPTDEDGVSNFATGALIASAMPAFSALDNN